jgi:hypothetical protein
MKRLLNFISQQGSQMGFQNSRELLTKSQEVPTKLKKIIKKFQEALKIFCQTPRDLGTLCQKIQKILQKLTCQQNLQKTLLVLSVGKNSPDFTFK